MSCRNEPEGSYRQDGVCHICQEWTSCGFCPLCCHWFCPTCSRDVVGRIVGSLREIFGKGSGPRCCGPAGVRPQEW